MIKKFTITFFFFIILILNLTATAQTSRNLLSGKITEQDLHSILLAKSNWHPFPLIQDREKWDNLPEKTRDLYIKNGEKYLGKEWEQLPATVFLEFVRNGNRSHYENILFNRRQQLESLVMAEIFENKGRFVDDIVNGVWSICEESFWGLPAHLNHQLKGFGLPDIKDPAVDLFAAETGALMAYVYYFLKDKLNDVSPRIPERIIEEENRRIINPFLNRDFSWEGRGENARVNNWNPWINSNLLATIFLLNENENLRNKVVYQIMTSLDVFINGYPDDGACDEGPGYWTVAAGAMFNGLEFLYSASDGKINIYNNPLIKKMGQYIYKVWIDDHYYINFADASAINSPDAGMVYRYGKRINDSLMIGFGALLAKQQNFSETTDLSRFGSLNNTIPNLFLIDEIQKTEIVKPIFADYWFPDRQIMTARSNPNSTQGFYLAAKGGNNNENHNHNDVGNFIIYYNGKPVMIDVGVETYTKKTFSKDRYDIWTMQSQYHNLPTINGVQQKNGDEFKAEDVKFSRSDDSVNFSLDISKCYPPQAEINYWKRRINFIRNSKIILEEDYSLKEFKEPNTLNFMTICVGDKSIPGKIILTERNNPSSKYQILYNPQKFNVEIEKIKIDDGRLTTVWGNEIERIVLKSLNNELDGNYSIEFSKILD